MSTKLPNVIAAEHLENVTTWQLPNMDGSASVIPSAEKEQRDRTSRANEIIEDVEDGESLTMSPITAEELQEITEAAEREGFEQGQKAGFEQGQQQGHDAGYQDGLAKAEAHANEVLQLQISQLLQVAEALVAPINEQQDQLQAILLQYVTSLTEQVIERELIQDSSHILQCVKQAMTALPVGSKNIRIALNPDDLALVESYSEEKDRGWSFQGDDQLLPGGCRIETAESLVDFTVESKMKAMFSQFLDRQLVDSTQESLSESNDDAIANDTAAGNLEPTIGDETSSDVDEGVSGQSELDSPQVPESKPDDSDSDLSL